MEALAAPAAMLFADRSDLTLRAMERMGRGFEYVDARADDIRPPLRHFLRPRSVIWFGRPGLHLFSVTMFGG